MAVLERNDIQNKVKYPVYLDCSSAPRGDRFIDVMGITAGLYQGI